MHVILCAQPKFETAGWSFEVIFTREENCRVWTSLSVTRPGHDEHATVATTLTASISSALA
jgi:hypothetical protein